MVPPDLGDFGGVLDILGTEAAVGCQRRGPASWFLGVIQESIGEPFRTCPIDCGSHELANEPPATLPLRRDYR